MSVISMKQLLEAGVHFGHQTRKWNPKMKKYIFTARNDIHIINLEDTSAQIDKAYLFVRDIVASGKSVLFVGTKKQAQEAIKEEAERCGMFYINTRWLGGCLTNFKTIKSRIERLNKLNQMEKVGEFDLLPKKEVTLLKAERDKLEKNLGGIKEMRELPGVVFLVDPCVEHICVSECKNLENININEELGLSNEAINNLKELQNKFYNLYIPYLKASVDFLLLYNVTLGLYMSYDFPLMEYKETLPKVSFGGLDIGGQIGIRF